MTNLSFPMNNFMRRICMLALEMMHSNKKYLVKDASGPRTGIVPTKSVLSKAHWLRVRCPDEARRLVAALYFSRRA